MRIFLLLLVLAYGAPGFAADKIREAIERGMVTKEFTDTLTQDDVPAKWRSAVEESQTDRYFKKAFMRGGHKVLEVMWSKDWIGARAKLFTASVYDGKARVAKILRVGEQTSVARGKDATGYELITSVKDDGRVSVMITGEKGYFEVIEVQGRDTHLLDDLEYTKAALLTSQFLEPLVDALQGQLESKPKKGTKK